jgi:hypothetical protein
MRCNVCDKDKEENQFQTYWHSSQQKMRTRKQCTECLYQNRLKNRNPEKYYQNNPNYHKCNTCAKWKLIDEFYTSKDKIYNNRCKLCSKELDKSKRLEELQESCGSDRISPIPNNYTDEFQKNCTFNLMEQLGYIYDEPTGIWTKPGWKEIVDGKPYFPHVYKIKKVGIKITETLIERMVQYNKLGWTRNRIAEELGISDITVYKYLKIYG